ncbi:hypothetical protein VTO42DRAFT_1981 [Malbranchea cinnamomea]
MRFLAKFYVLAALAACCILYSLWSLNSYYTSNKAPMQQYHYRLVTFGDSWSDVNATRNPHQDKLWTEQLCSQFSCLQENMAESADPPVRLTSGALVDNGELESSDDPAWSSPPADLKTQISRWLEKEKQAVQDLSDDHVSRRANRTLFSVSFGVWDLWRLITKEVDNPKASIQRIVQKLFDNLNDLASSVPADGIKIILLAPVDVTFLPAYGSKGQGTHRDAIGLFEEWNDQLRNHTAGWSHGTIYLVDTNAFLVDQIRERHLWVAGYIETQDYGKTGVAWENVHDPCISNPKNGTSNHGDICGSPEKVLFWDSMHLGPTAHKLLGTEIFKGISDLWL